MGLNDAVVEDKIRSAAMGLIPAGGEFVTKSQRQGQLGSQANDILRIPGTEQRAPVHLRGRGVVEEASYGALQELLQAGKGRLAKLRESQILIGLQWLQPQAGAEVVASSRQGHVILKGVEIAGDMEIATHIASGQADLCGWIRSGTSADHNRAHWLVANETRNVGRRGSRRGLAGIEIGGS